MLVVSRRAIPALLLGLLVLLVFPPRKLGPAFRSAAVGAPPVAAVPEPLANVFPPIPVPGPAAKVPSLLVTTPRVTSAYAVRDENARAGSAVWKITNYASLGEIQAYAGNQSVNAGAPLDFYVSTRVPGTTYRIDIFRMGWYGGTGARLATSITGLVGSSQGSYTPSTGLIGCGRCRNDASTGLLDANWTASYHLSVPGDWVSGVYLALFTDARGKQAYTPFVVRQDDRVSALVFQASFNTYEAYNAWGGKSLYSSNSLGPNTVTGATGAVKVSFNRPFDADFGSGHFLRYEYNLVRWLEKSGYDVTYVTDRDVATDNSMLMKHRGYISAGHDEYWTLEQRRNVEDALSHGLHLAFLSGDTMYWQARFESSATGGPTRTLVVYRGRPDPLLASDPARASVRWQDAPVNRPENAVTGTIYAGQTEPFTQDWVVKDTNSWLFEGSGLNAGDHVPGLVGKEFDRAARNSSDPAGLQVLSHSTITQPQVSRRALDDSFAETTIYTAPSGAIVFSAATVTWSWGLDDASFPLVALHKTPVSAAIQRMTANLLDMICFGPPTAP